MLEAFGGTETVTPPWHYETSVTKLFSLTGGVDSSPEMKNLCQRCCFVWSSQPDTEHVITNGDKKQI